MDGEMRVTIEVVVWVFDVTDVGLCFWGFLFHILTVVLLIIMPSIWRTGLIFRVINSIWYIHINKIRDFMAYEYKIEDLESGEWFYAEIVEEKLSMAVICSPETKPKKFVADIDIGDGQYPQLTQFDSCKELLRLLSTGKSYHFDFEAASFVLIWQVVAGSFKKDVECRVKMNERVLSSFDELKIENTLLKKKISLYQNGKHELDTSFMRPDCKDGIDLLQIKQIQSANCNKEELQKESQSKSCQVIESLGSEVEKKPKRKTTKNKMKAQSIQKSNRSQIRKKGRKKREEPATTTSNKDAPKDTNMNCTNAKITFENGDYYYGELKNNVYHGHGLYYSVANGTFQGEWENGKANGYGVSKDPSGNQHSGNYVNDKRNGKGVDVYTNGEKYTGDFQNDAKSGMGKYSYANGDYYEGQWKNDMYHGRGKENYSDGSYYEGTWNSDQKDGQGILVTKEGKKWKQLWHKGIKIQEYEVKEEK